MTSRASAQRAAEYLLRRACRRLPAGTRDERYAEWAAELPAILHDPDIRHPFARSARALRYAAGVYRSTRRLPEAAGSRPWGDRQPAIFPRPDGVLPGLAAVASWICLVLTARYFPHGGPWWPLLAVALFVPDVLAVIAIIRFVRWLRRPSRGSPSSPG
ncbi:MAG TPA: hypothetical protein VIX86_17235 [Streptosporangiaceae bacterium]